MRDVKYALRAYSFYDHTGLERYFEKMASKGWMVEKQVHLGWRFRRVEPQGLKFAVTYFPKATDFDPMPGEGQQTFWEMCGAAGWRLACAMGSLQVFFSVDPDAVPIETDPLLQIRNIHGSAKKTLWVYALFIAIGLLQLWRMASMLKNPVELFASGTHLYCGIVWVVMLILGCGEHFAYYRWRRRALRAAEERGEFIPTRGTGRLQTVCLLLASVCLCLWIISVACHGDRLSGAVFLGYLGGYAVMLWLLNRIKERLKRSGMSAKGNFAVVLAADILFAVLLVSVTLRGAMAAVDRGFFERHKPVKTVEADNWIWNIYADEIPLRVEELTDVDTEGYSYRKDRQGSFFLTRTECRQWAPPVDGSRKPELEYTVVDVHFAPLYQLCLNSVLRVDEEEAVLFGISWEQADSAVWGAGAAWRKYYHGEPAGEFVLRYDDKIVELKYDGMDLEDGQLRLIGERFLGSI